MKISGIYKIINKINGKYYVGSSKDIINSRWSYHRKCLRGKYHKNDYLQKAWNKYGESNFDFIIVEEVYKEKLLLVEQKYLDIAKTEQDKCYNLNFNARGGDISEYSRTKIGDKNRGKNCFSYGEKLSNEIRQKMSIARKKFIGEKHPCYKQTIYSFLNKKTNEKFSGTSYNFRIQYNLSQPGISALTRKRQNTFNNWILLN